MNSTYYQSIKNRKTYLRKYYEIWSFERLKHKAASELPDQTNETKINKKQINSKDNNMKKLCTYLTLLVVMVLGVTQTALAEVDTNRYYYFSIENIVGDFTGNKQADLVIWDGSTNQTCEYISDTKVFRYKPTKSDANTWTVKRIANGTQTDYFDMTPPSKTDWDDVFVLGWNTFYWKSKKIYYDPNKTSYTIYFRNNMKWATPIGFHYFDFYDLNNNKTGSSNPIEMTLVSGDLYKIEINNVKILKDNTHKAGIIFKSKGTNGASDWNNSTQTRDEYGIIDKMIYKIQNKTENGKYYLDVEGLYEDAKNPDFKGKFYITGDAIRGWGDFVEMNYDSSTKTWSYDGAYNDEFKIVDMPAWDNNAHKNEYKVTGTFSSSEPNADNFAYTNGEGSSNITMPVKGSIYVKETENGYKIWYVQKDVPITKMYIFGGWNDGDDYHGAMMFPVAGKPGVYRYGELKKDDKFKLSSHPFNWNKSERIFRPNSGNITVTTTVTSSNICRTEHNAIKGSNDFIMGDDGCVFFDISDINNPKIWLEKEHEYTWNDFQHEVYLTGMRVGYWANEDNHDWKKYTYIMERVLEQPGLWRFPIFKENKYKVMTVENSTPHDQACTSYNTDFFQDKTKEYEKFHLMFSTFGNFPVGDEPDNEEGFWDNAFKPYSESTIEVNKEKRRFVGGIKTSRNFFCSDANEGWLFVDLVNHLAWMENYEADFDADKSDEVFAFYFWDKDNDAFGRNDLNWWKDNVSNRTVKIVYVDENGNEVSSKTQTFRAKVNSNDNSLISLIGNHETDGTYDGKLYYVSDNIREDMLGASAYNVYIYKGTENSYSYSLKRPYVYEATYTQPLSDGGDIPAFAAQNLEVKMEPFVRVIKSGMSSTRISGGMGTEDEVIDYPFVNQYVANLEITQKPVDDKYTTSLAKMTREQKITIETEGLASHEKTGVADNALLTGLNFLNPKSTDMVSVNMSYKANDESMSFDRSRQYKIATYIDHHNADFEDRDLEEDLSMPEMVVGENLPHLYKLTAEAFYGDNRYYDSNNEISIKDHTVVDLFLHMVFGDIEPESKLEYFVKKRAAYIDYNILRVGDAANLGCQLQLDLLEGEDHVMNNGRPVTWEYAPQGTVSEDDVIAHDPNYWYYEAFHQQKLDLQLSHVYCATSPEALKNKKLSVEVEYELIVPVATTRSVLLGESYEPEATPEMSTRRRASAYEGEMVPDNVDMSVDEYDGRLMAPSGDAYKTSDTAEIVLDGNITTGVEEVAIEGASGEVEYFNLQGMRVGGEQLAPGMYIRRAGNVSTKVYIR